MKIVITENKLEKVLKQSGTKKTIELLGSWENFCKVFNIEGPMDFLHLFDDLSRVKSIKHPYMDIFRYEKGDNIISYDREDGKLYVSWFDIWKVLKFNYELKPDELRQLIKKWVQNEFKIDNITSILNISVLSDEWLTIN